STAASASSTRVMPQILLRTRIRFVPSASRASDGNKGSTLSHICQTGEKVRAEVARWQIELLGVFHLHQIEPVGMRGHATTAALRPLQHLTDPAYRTLPGADGHQHTGDVAHHVMQEGIGANVQHDEATM